MQRFTEIRSWQKAHALVLAVYRLTQGFPAAEKFGLTSQIRRAVLSVAVNIAEGLKRDGRKEYSRFLNISEASLAETEYMAMVARDLEYITQLQAGSLLNQATNLARMLHALRLRVDSGQDY